MAENADAATFFKRFDTDGDGRISSTELGDALKQFGNTNPAEVERMMKEIDTDGDGFISFEEFAVFHNANYSMLKDIPKA